MEKELFEGDKIIWGEPNYLKETKLFKGNKNIWGKQNYLRGTKLFMGNKIIERKQIFEGNRRKTKLFKWRKNFRR